MQLQNRVALVTGASSGIGLALARELARREAIVTLVARNEAALNSAAEGISHDGGRARVEVADLGQVDEVQDLAARVLAESGPPDLLINNAGAGRWLATDETPPGMAEELMRVPYLAAFEMTRAFLPAMIERGSGRIALMTSLAAFAVIPGATGYAVARAAMRAFADQLRSDVRGTGVGVTLLVPAEVDSPYFDNNPGVRERVPRVSALFGAAASPEAIAKACVRGIERDRDQVVAPRLAATVLRLTPRPLVNHLAARTGWKRV